MIKRLHTCILMIAVLLTSTAISVSAQGVTWTGSGDTADDPRQVDSKEKLKAIGADSESLQKHYKLMNEIDLGDAAWTPIGNYNYNFKGTFDGQGFVISGLNVPPTNTNDYAGLFGYIGTGGTVKNLGVNGSVAASATEAKTAYAGGIAGHSNGTITNCYTDVEVSARSNYDAYAGGIAGNMRSATTSHCYAIGNCTGNYSGSSSGTIRVGGIAGSKEDGSLSYCYATGTIGTEGSTTTKYVGGIAGQNSGELRNCIALNTGGITGEAGKTYRIVGSGSSNISNCYAAPSIPGIWADKGLTARDGADLNTTNFTGDGATGAFDSWPTAAWNFTATRLPTLLGFKEGQTVIECAPFLIKPDILIGNADELAAFRDAVNSGNTYQGETVKLTAPITLSGEWKPIGTFNGTFDGDGYVITMSNATASLFKTINKDGTVKNLGINATITAKDKVGGIAATNKGMIQRCYVEGSITSDGVYISGIADNQGTIEDCYTTVSVTTTGYYSGGIAGGNYEGTIRRCYATGAISSPGSAGIAGTGISTNSIQSCIALNESITGTGAHARVANGDGTFTGNYASPAIAGTWNNIGADKKDGADLTAANFIGKGAGEGAFTAWSGDIWDFGDNTNLPTLKGFKADQSVAGITRKSAIPLITAIATADDLATFRDAVNNDSETYKGKTVKLTADITVSDWSKPIGKITYFKGTFDGQGHVITLTGTASLFGTINEDATIENLGVKVTLTSDYESFTGIVAGIVDTNYGMIQHCYTEGTIGNAFLGGGIAVSNYKQIQDCYSTVSISSKNRYGGGIVYENQGTIQRCYTTGAVKAVDIAGGIAAMNYAERNIESCIALNTSIEGTIGSLGRIAGTNGGKLTGNYASLLIAGTWSDKGANEIDGADLMDENFIGKGAGEGAFADWQVAVWDFSDLDKLPKLKTTGNNVINGQGDANGNMPARANFLELPIEISTAVAYDAATHDGKNIRVTAGGIFTIAADGASFKKLTLEEGGQVVAEKEFKCDMLLAPHTLGNKWTAYGSPVTMNAVAETSQKFYRLAGYKDAGDQSWSSSTSSTTTSFPILALNLIATDAGNVSVTLTAPLSEGTPVTIPADAAPTTGSDLNTGKFLFVANPTLKDVTVPVAYLLSADGTRFVRTEKAKVKPFQSYVVANAVTSGAILSLRAGNGTPTGNDPIALPDGTFRVWSADGQLHLSADTPHDVTVYNQSGRLVRRLTLTGEQTLALPRGIYFVNTTHITYKVSL